MSINSLNIPPIDDFPGDGGSLPVSITTTEFSVGNVGTPYLEYLDATAGYPPYSWTKTLGALPPGLSLISTGIITGTPTTVGSYTFTIKVTDSIGATDVRSFYLQIDDVEGPVITTTILPPVLVNTPYDIDIEVTGGTPPYVNWDVIVGSLPDGLTLNSSTGELTGTPTIPGSYPFTIEVEDTNGQTDIQAYTLVVQAVNPTIITTGLSDGVTGIFYSNIIHAQGGTTPYTNWDVTIGELPPGLVLTGGSTSATISGTPTSTGSYTFTVRVIDSLSGTDTQVLTINIYDGTEPIISTISLPDGQIGNSYSETLIAVGGSLPYQWSLLEGQLPVGLELNSTTGIISGTPTANGSYIFTVKVIDYNNNIDTQILSIIIGNYTLPAIITEQLPNTIIGDNYSSYIQALGGSMPYTWSFLSPLPDGLFLDYSSGLISGIPTTDDVTSFDIVVTDINGHIDIKNFTIEVGVPELPIISTTIIPSGDRTILYNQTLKGLGGVPSYNWTVISGVLPDGISLSSNGILSGIPTAIGVYPFTVKLTDSASNIDTQDYTLIIKSPGYNSRCCTCVFTGDIIEFKHNSTNGILKATGGSVLTNTTWQAPSVEGFYEVSITAEGVNGIITVSNIINVIKRLEIIGNTNFINHLLPGDSFFIETNYPPEQITWETLDYDIPIITPDGHVFINTNPADKCFGAMECTVRGTLNNIENCNINAHIDVKIQVNPVYPTPDNCGPDITKWLREYKDFRVIITEFEGGCDETHIRNKVPILRWTITYDGLSNYKDDKRACPNCGNITTNTNCCNTNFNFQNNINGCPPILKSSNRLDDFWNLVYGQYKSFTLIDYDTDEIWYNVRFADNLTIDHRHRRTSTSRTTKLVWKPCCDKYPAGGTCSKHGIMNYKPSYQRKINSSCNLIDNILIKIQSKAFTSINLKWSISSLNEISGYQLRINGDIYNNFTIDVGDINEYNWSGLKSSTNYLFEVRAYDDNYNYSPWSTPVNGRTLSDTYITFDGEPLVFNGNQIIFEE